MFPYDSQLVTLLQTAPRSIADVLATMQSIDALTVDGDGLKWFNWLYFQVTQAVETRVSSGGFTDPSFLSDLDIQFAHLYFNALKNSLSSEPLPDCWQTLFAVRNQTSLARIQFAMAGINAHINHDLPIAIVATCASESLIPQHGTTQYTDYTSLNSTLDSLIEEAKQTLNVRLLGDVLPGCIAARKHGCRLERQRSARSGLEQRRTAVASECGASLVRRLSGQSRRHDGLGRQGAP